MGSNHSWLQLLLMLTLFHNSDAQMVRCDMPADVVFLLDASASIKANEWEQEKDFVGILIDSLAVERHAINVGMIVYSTEIGQVVDLQPFKNRDQLKAELPKLQQTSQGTDTARAIRRMRQMMANQARDQAMKIAVVITDGRSANSTSTIQEAVYARQVDGIMMIALGVGNETYKDELEEIARSDIYPDQNRLFTVRNFAELQDVVQGLRNLICEAVPETTTTTSTTTTTTTTVTIPSFTTPVLPPISCPRPADVLFLLDGSHSITDADWAMGRVFVSTLLNSLEVDIDAIHAGIIVYSSNIGDTVPLKPFLDKETLKAKASALNQPPLARTNTAMGLAALRSMFQAHGRPDVPHIGIVITDGKSSNVQATMDEAFRAKSEDGIVLLVVGVGDDTLALELEAMATSRDTLFNVTGFSALFDIAQALSERICIETEPSTTTTTTTTPTTPTIPDLCQECLVQGGIGYNSYPPDCTKYVTCYPQKTGGYRTEVKDCPFGLFWSSQAVACVDAAYVNCSADRCRGRPEGWGHTEGTRGCGEYWRCRGGRSMPHCCPQGQRYSGAMQVCLRDASCRRQCSVQWTVAGSGACAYRPNPADPFSFLQVMPGLGQVTHPCSPGTVYSHSQCACVFYTPSLGCVPSLHYTFDGTFDDKSPHRHPAQIQRVLLTKHGSAYFNKTGQIRVNTLPSNEFKDKLVLRLRYRIQPDQPSGIHWNDHYNWGLQEWFSSHTSPHKNLTFSGGSLPNTGPEPGLPSGQQTSTLEEVVILRNGTVLHGQKGADPNGGWPGAEAAGRYVSRVQLGPMSEIQDTAVSGGVVYVPNGRGQLLILRPKTSSGLGASWQIVTKDGRVVKSGSGEVPHPTAASFGFQLRPAPTARWFIMTANGAVLSSGTGAIPDNVKSLYAGFTSGKLVKVDQIGEDVVQWSVSRPDGSGATGGKGPIPAALRQTLKLDEVLGGGSVKRWAMLSSTGDVLETGTGEVPADVLSKYSWLRSGVVLTDTGSHWKLHRADGTKLLEGTGTLPSGVTRFIKGSLVLPSLVKTSTWSVRLPNGTRLTGKGPIPAHIQRLFDQLAAGGAAVGGSGSAGSSGRQWRWYVTDSAGTVLESGYGDMPQSLAERYRGRADTKVMQQRTVQGSNLPRWEVRGPGGVMLASGVGQPPADVFQVVKGQKQTSIRTQTVSDRTMTSGANYPDRQAGTGARENQSSRPSQSQTAGKAPAQTASSGGARGRQQQARVETIRRWTLTMPDGSVRSGTGEIPANLRALLDAQARRSSGQRGPIVNRRWSLTMPNGTVTTGTGEVPAHLRALLEAQRARGALRTQSRWSVTLPDGSKQSGVGDIPAEVQERMARGQGRRHRWRVRMPDGTMQSGRGAIPADLTALMETLASNKSAGDALSRGRRAAGERYQEVLGYCGSPQPPSFLLTSSHRHVQLVLRTTNNRRGATLTLPITLGQNDVQFVYDGKTLTGFSNGVQKSVQLTGTMLPIQAPLTIGGCRGNASGFRGEIDDVSLSSCIP